MINYKRVVCEGAVLLALLAVAFAAPKEYKEHKEHKEPRDCVEIEKESHYDQRQNGTENYRLNIDGVVIAVAPAESILEAAADFTDIFDIDDIEDLLKPPSSSSSSSSSNSPSSPSSPSSSNSPSSSSSEPVKPEASADAKPEKPAEAPLSDVSLNSEKPQRKDATTGKQDKVQR